MATQIWKGADHSWLRVSTRRMTRWASTAMRLTVSPVVVILLELLFNVKAWWINRKIKKKEKYIEMLRNYFLRVDSFCLDFSVWNPCGSSLSKAILIGYWFILFILFNTLSRLITKLIFHDFLHFIGHYPCTLRRKNEEQKISRFTYKKEISNHSMRNHRGVNWNKMFHCTSSGILKPQELQCSFAHNNILMCSK